MDLLRWWRFLHAVEVSWDRATRVDARDFSCWIQLAVKPRATAARRRSARTVGAPNPVTGKTGPGLGYAPSTVAHSETVLRRFYDLHRDAGSGPLLNPFPLDLARRSGRAHARTTTRWKSGRQSGPAATGPRFPAGFRARSRTSGSTRCSRRCGRTETGP
nr:hypothetical protein [Streptomyces marianii]